MKSLHNEQVRGGGVSGKWLWILLLVFLVLVLLGLFLILMQREKQAPKPPPSSAKAEIISRKIVVPVVDLQVATLEKTPKAQPPATPAPIPAPPVPPKPERFYEAKRGECLWEIAARPEIYNKPEMWTVLYRANPGVMDYYYQKGGAPFVIIDPGVRLRIPESQKVKRLQDDVAKKLWVLQLSANRNIRFALILAARIKGSGCVVYVMEDLSGRQPWYLVRMGFFTNREKARVGAGKVARRTGHSEYVIRPASRSEIKAHLPFP